MFVLNKFVDDLSFTMATFQSRSQSTYLVSIITIRIAGILSKLYMDILQINISDEFNVDLSNHSN